MAGLSIYNIEPKGEKGRVFQSRLVSFLRADQLTPESGGGNNVVRPVWAMFAGSLDELRPFMANLQLGRTAKEGYRGRHSLEFLKSIRWRVIYQKENEGVLATIYHPELFEMDPGMVDPTRIDFVLLVDEEWKKSQKVDLDRARNYLGKVGGTESMLDLLPIAPLFAVYLDRRTRCPLVNDDLFYFHLLLMALKDKLAVIAPSGGYYLSGYAYHERFGVSSRHGVGHEDLDKLKSEAVAFSCTHSVFEPFLAEQVSVFYSLNL